MSSDKGHLPVKTRLLFVDDEEAIRQTLPIILEQHGFDVKVTSTVPEALDLINHQKFDVLLTDLNIGTPADGFILVTAMRRCQPSASTFILTGYPDFQTALEAIRQQVDDYLIKPADIPKLISTLKEKALQPRHFNESPSKQTSGLILEKSDEIVQQWLTELQSDLRLASIKLTKEELIDRFPQLVTDLAKLLETGAAKITAKSLKNAASHGAERAKQGYTIPLLVTETRILNRVIGLVLQENLLAMNLSTLIPDALKVGEYLQALLEESIRAFQGTQSETRLGAKAS
jgi:YesN/AraC family two-component response regulator